MKGHELKNLVIPGGVIMKQAQAGLVEILARFNPKLVKMAPGGESED